MGLPVSSAMYPIDIPIPIPLPNPISTNSHSNQLPSPLSLGSDGGSNDGLHPLVSGNPQRPGFPSKELFGKVLNCPPVGICPIRLFRERFKNTRNDSRFSSFGIFPTRRFDERSRDSRFFRFPRDGGIVPVRLLLEKLRPLSQPSNPIYLGPSIRE